MFKLGLNLAIILKLSGSQISKSNPAKYSKQSFGNVFKHKANQFPISGLFSLPAMTTGTPDLYNERTPKPGGVKWPGQTPLSHGLSPVPCLHRWLVAYLRTWAGDSQKAASGQAATLQPANRRCFMHSTTGRFAFPAERALVPRTQGPCGMPLDFSASKGLPLIHFCTLWLVAQTIPLEG